MSAEGSKQRPHRAIGAKVVLAALIVLGAFGVWMLLRSGGDQVAGGPARGGVKEVLVHEVENRMFVAEVQALGTVSAVENADISSSVTEVVEELRFENGQAVERGDVLALLSSGEEQAALLSAGAGLREQQREVRRLEGLVKEGGVSEFLLEERRTMLEVAEQQIAEAEARLRDRKIVAPFPGILGLRRISVGALVSPGTVITTLDQIDRVYVDFTVAEAYLGDLEKGLKLIARASAYASEDFEAEVLAIDSRVDPVTRAVEVRAVIDNADHKLRPGMLLTTRLQRDPREAPGVPERALTQIGERSFIFLIEEGDEGTVARRRNIETGRRVPGWVEVIDGLEAGARVVSDGLIGLTDGTVIEIKGAYEGPSEPFDPRAN